MTLFFFTSLICLRHSQHSQTESQLLISHLNCTSYPRSLSHYSTFPLFALIWHFNVSSFSLFLRQMWQSHGPSFYGSTLWIALSVCKVSLQAYGQESKSYRSGATWCGLNYFYFGVCLSSCHQNQPVLLVWNFVFNCKHISNWFGSVKRNMFFLEMYKYILLFWTRGICYRSE